MGVKAVKDFCLQKACEKFNKFVQRQRYQMTGMKGEKKMGFGDLMGVKMVKLDLKETTEN